jgi:hypothetical protein
MLYLMFEIFVQLYDLVFHRFVRVRFSSVSVVFWPSVQG